MPSITARIAATAAAAVALAATPGVVATGLSAAQSRVSATATVVPASGTTTEDQSTWTRRHGGSPGYAGQGLGSSGSGSSGSDATGSSDLSRAADGSTISGTEVASMKGVVMVDTVLPDGRGAGTGMILTAGGEVLTNYHVVEGSTSITVTDTTTGRTYPATVVGHDAAHDVAVLRLSGASGLSTVTVDRSPAQVGQSVVAVGQGGGQGAIYQVTGSVTALDQTITAQDETSVDSGEQLTGLIRTTADVVPGYSGGPLLDTSGRVIGIDTAATSGGDIDGYAVPISQALAIADQITAGVRSDDVHVGARAALGVQVIDVTAGGYGGSRGATGMPSGAAVADVVAGGAAAAAGITAGSTITAVDGDTVTSGTDLSEDLSDEYPGTRVTVTWTDPSGTTRSTSVTLGTSTVA